MELRTQALHGFALVVAHDQTMDLHAHQYHWKGCVCVWLQHQLTTRPCAQRQHLVFKLGPWGPWPQDPTQSFGGPTLRPSSCVACDTEFSSSSLGMAISPSVTISMSACIPSMQRSYRGAGPV